VALPTRGRLFDGCGSFVSEIVAVQNVLGVLPDGNPGQITWNAIERAVCGSGGGKSIPESIKRVQKALGIPVDGVAGNQTWRAIATRLIPAPESRFKGGMGRFPEEVALSAQTTGKNALRIKPEAIVLHHTSGNFEGSVDWTRRLTDDKGKRLYASYHCIIARDGRRAITTPDESRAYHAGASAFKGRSGCNQWSLGMAWERDTNTEPLQEAAIESALEWLLPRMKRWGITPENVTDHRTVATPAGRKNDLKREEFERFHAILKERWEAL
jgi:AmpD protein